MRIMGVCVWLCVWLLLFASCVSINSISSVKFEPKQEPTREHPVLGCLCLTLHERSAHLQSVPLWIIGTYRPDPEQWMTVEPGERWDSWKPRPKDLVCFAGCK